MPQREFANYMAQEGSAVTNRFSTAYCEEDVVAALAPQGESVLRDTTRYLDVCVMAAVLSEVSEELGIRTLADAKAHGAAFFTALDARLGSVDPRPTIREMAASMEERMEPPDLDAVAAVPLAGAIALARTTVATIPLDAIEIVARGLDGMVEFGHRCRLAVEFLEAFVRRNDPGFEERSAAIGRAYAEGRLSIHEVALLSDERPEDAVAFLETHGYCRPLDVIRLQDGERAAILQRIREDRLRRNGRPAFSREMVARVTIASERIENVDARRWIPITD